MTRGMARRLGVNLTEAMLEGTLTRADFAQMINRCRDCKGTEGCLDYLSERSGKFASAPDWCSNVALLRELSEMN